MNAVLFCLTGVDMTVQIYVWGKPQGSIFECLPPTSVVLVSGHMFHLDDLLCRLWEWPVWHVSTGKCWELRHKAVRRTIWANMLTPVRVLVRGGQRINFFCTTSPQELSNRTHLSSYYYEHNCIVLWKIFEKQLPLVKAINHLQLFIFSFFLPHFSSYTSYIENMAIPS